MLKGRGVLALHICYRYSAYVIPKMSGYILTAFFGLGIKRTSHANLVPVRQSASLDSCPRHHLLLSEYR